MIKEIKKKRIFDEFKRIIDDVLIYNVFVTDEPNFYIYIDHIKRHAPYTQLEDKEIIDFVNSTYNKNNYNLIVVDKHYETREYLSKLLL